ncbi:MAG: PAS domain S-box protein [Chromatiales bacterium]|nr:PAS domain S-box protein [Chromatiales bacterium]
MILPQRGVRWLRGESVPERLDDGSVLWHGYITDVTEFKHAQEELQRTYGENRAVTEAVRDNLFMLNPAGELVWWNRRVEETTGLAAVQLRGTPGVSFFHEDDRAAVVQALAQVAVTGYAEIEARLLTIDGPRDYQYIGVRVLDEAGRVLGIAGSGRDISERKRTEQALRVKDDAIAASINGIAFADLAGTLTYVNRAFLRMWGYDREQEVIGRSALEFWQHPDEAAQVLAALATQDGWSGELTARRQDGSLFVALFSAAVIRDTADRPFQLMGSFVDVTERRRAEEEARIFQNLINVAGQGIGMARMDSGVSYLNDALRRMLGVAADEDLAKYSFYDFYADEDRAFLEARVLPAVLEQGSWTGELSLRAAGGVSVPTIHNVFLLRDAAGAPVAIANVLTDISEQRRAASALQESEQRFRSIIEASPVPYALNDDHQNITYLNPAFIRTVGYTRDDIPTLADWWPRAYPDPVYRQWVATEWAARLERARRQGSAFEPMELNIRCKDGTTCTVMASAASLGQAFAGTHLVILYDITAHRRAEQALRASEARLRTILETEPECVKILAANGTLLEMNPAGLAMLEADSVAQLQGRTVATFVTGEQRAAFVELGRRVIENGESGRLEFEIVGLKGTRRWLETNAVPLRDEVTGETRLLGVTRDITERRRAEEGIRTLNAELEQRVKDRTAELEAANRELEAFSYSVSHDLRAPLRAIDGFSRVLVEDHASHLDAEAQDYLNRVRNAVQRMGVLIDDLLDLSRVGRAAMHVTAVDLSSLAAEAVAQLRHGDPARTVEVDIAPGITAQGDPRLLRVVLENLLGNAWKYTGRTAAAHIAFATGTSNGQRVYRIADNGAGFDMQYADKLFRPFQRLHTLQEFPGSGVGLATVARIVHRHGGRVWAEGEPGRGASFFFTLGG